MTKQEIEAFQRVAKSEDGKIILAHLKNKIEENKNVIILNSSLEWIQINNFIERTRAYQLIVNKFENKEEAETKEKEEEENGKS